MTTLKSKYQAHHQYFDLIAEILKIPMSLIQLEYARMTSDGNI